MWTGWKGEEVYQAQRFLHRQMEQKSPFKRLNIWGFDPHHSQSMNGLISFRLSISRFGRIIATQSSNSRSASSGIRVFQALSKFFPFRLESQLMLPVMK